VDVNAQHHERKTALKIAMEQGHSKIAKLLMEAGAKQYEYLYLLTPVKYICNINSQALRKLLFDGHEKVFLEYISV
jgi:ankyrin repeat protein